jgi:hypothetical protein
VVNLLQDAGLAGRVHRPGEHAVVNGVQDDATI